MAKIEVLAQDVKEEINQLQLFRSGWANDIREGWNFGMSGAKEILFELYEVSGSIILALQQIQKGRYRDKMAMILVKNKLQKLVDSETFKEFETMGREGMCRVVTSGTKHHIRVMFEDLKILTE